MWGPRVHNRGVILCQSDSWQKYQVTLAKSCSITYQVETQMQASQQKQLHNNVQIHRWAAHIHTRHVHGRFINLTVN